MEMNPSGPEREWRRHALATLAYRAANALRDAPAGFAEYHVSETSRTPARILAHMGDLLDWALSLLQGNERWHDAEPLPWEEELRRFHAALEALDACLGSGLALGSPAERLFQGPIADALTHVGQIAMLRRLAGAPVRGENYFRAKIGVGLRGPDQPAPVREFD